MFISIATRMTISARLNFYLEFAFKLKLVVVFNSLSNNTFSDLNRMLIQMCLIQKVHVPCGSGADT